MSDSFARKIKRQAMKDCGTTFADRLREAVRTGTKVADVLFKVEGSGKDRKVLAIAK